MPHPLTSSRSLFTHHIIFVRPSLTTHFRFATSPNPSSLQHSTYATWHTPTQRPRTLLECQLLNSRISVCPLLNPQHLEEPVLSGASLKLS